MKINKKEFLMLATAALLTVSTSALLTACADEATVSNDGTPSTGTLDRGEVKAEFTISFPQKVGTTRQAEATVQAQGQAFRGITGIELYAFGNTVDEIAAAPASTAIGTQIILAGSSSTGTSGASSTVDNQIDASGMLYSGSNSHIYQNVPIPIGAKTFLLYGQAVPTYTTDTPAATDLFANGTLKKTLDGEYLSGLTFSPVSIRSTNEVSQYGGYIAGLLTSIARVTGWSSSKDVKLQTLYQAFIKIKSGSWANTKQAVQELYKSVYGRTDDVSTAIRTTIEDAKFNGENKFVTDVSGSTLTFTDDTNMGNYPEDMHLPAGAAQVKFAEGAFSVVTATDNTGLDVTNLTDYAYPAALYYRALSKLRVANESMKKYFDGTNTWTTILDKYGTEETSIVRTVAADTRSIAMEDQIEYAVARLDVSVKSDGFTVKDFEGNDVQTSGQNFKLTGVLVSGIRPVDYKFKPVAGTTYTIYDNTMSNDIYLVTTTGEPLYNHTLVLETDRVTSDDEKIRIALEFVNNSGKTVIGKDGCIIYPKCKFYMIGELVPNLNSTAKYTDGTPIKQAFLQDYTTTANFTIKSLKDARNTLPDLRSPELEIGMSVNTDWNNGIIQDIIID